MASNTRPTGHERIETSNFLMIVLILVAVAMGEAAAAEFQRPSDPARINFCALQMLAELAATDTIDKPLPKPVKSK